MGKSCKGGQWCRRCRHSVSTAAEDAAAGWHVNWRAGPRLGWAHTLFPSFPFFPEPVTTSSVPSSSSSTSENPPGQAPGSGMSARPRWPALSSHQQARLAVGAEDGGRKKEGLARFAPCKNVAIVSLPTWICRPVLASASGIDTHACLWPEGPKPFPAVPAPLWLSWRSLYCSPVTLCLAVSPLTS